MPLLILSRRSLVYRESGGGEVSVLMVPGQDQIQVVKDLAGLGKADMPVREKNPQAKGASARKQEQLSRVHVGRRFIYGNLPVEVSDLRQPVKVWLAEDYAPPQSQAFFFVFDSKVVIHGVRERDDEGQQNWRTAQLSLGEADPVKSIIDAISDYALVNTTDSLTVAVQSKLDLYEKLQEGLATYNISPVPFSKLKPLPGLKPLYRHHDFTILYLTLALFGLITVLASGTYTFFTMMERNKLDEQVEGIQRQIQSIKLNQNVGQVEDPQALLQAMNRGINQQPSAILHAAGEVGAQLGTLEQVKVLFDGGDYEGVNMEPPSTGQIATLLNVSEMKNELLVDQEQKAADLIATHPWVRSVVRGGVVGKQGLLGVTLQVDQPPETEGVPFTPQEEAIPVTGGAGETPSGTETTETFVAVDMPRDASVTQPSEEGATQGAEGEETEQESQP